jgi:K+-transporting ATPase c subunit
MKKVQEWFKDQYGKAKVAWMIVVVIASLFGYTVQLSVTPMETEIDRIANQTGQAVAEVKDTVTTTADVTKTELGSIAVKLDNVAALLEQLAEKE